MGSRAKCQNKGSFGAKVLTEDEGIIVGVVRPNRGRALWKNQRVARKGHRGVKYSKVLKDAQKQTAEAKAKDIVVPKKDANFFKKGLNFFQRKGS